MLGLRQWMIDAIKAGAWEVRKVYSIDELSPEAFKRAIADFKEAYSKGMSHDLRYYFMKASDYDIMEMMSLRGWQAFYEDGTWA